MSNFLVRALLLTVVSVPMASSAYALTYTEEVTINPIECSYQRVYVPAQVQVNTRGRLVRGSSRGFVVNGDTWNYVNNPATYIETRRVVSPDHYTLVPVSGSHCN